MELVYYETGIKVPTAGGWDYVNVFVTQNEAEARSAYHGDRRNYLARLTFREDGCHTTAFLDPVSDTWKPEEPHTNNG